MIRYAPCFAYVAALFFISVGLYFVYWPLAIIVPSAIVLLESRLLTVQPAQKPENE